MSNFKEGDNIRMKPHDGYIYYVKKCLTLTNEIVCARYDSIKRQEETHTVSVFLVEKINDSPFKTNFS